MTKKKYSEMSDLEKKNFLKDSYYNKNMSWIQISKALSTYPNKVRRDANRV